MKKLFNTQHQNNRGFSLVELIIVIAIMAILAGALAPMLLKYVEKSRNSVDADNAQKIANAIIYYYTENEEYAAAIDSACDASGGVHCIVLTVTDALICVDSSNQEALREQSLIMTPIRKDRFDNIKCKSNQNWDSYYIIMSTYETNGLDIVFIGNKNNSVSQNHSWNYWKTATDSTGFRDLMNNN